MNKEDMRLCQKIFSVLCKSKLNMLQKIAALEYVKLYLFTDRFDEVKKIEEK